MERQTLAKAYMWAVAVVGLAMLAISTALRLGLAHDRLESDLANAGILFVITVLASIYPLKTRLGATVTVGLAPLFGAFVVLPVWLVMWVAALGTIDQRRPGGDPKSGGIPWDRFFFNRGLFTLMYGIPSLAFLALNLHRGQANFYLALPAAVAAMVILNVLPLAVSISLVDGIAIATAIRRMVAGRLATYIALPLLGYLVVVLLDQPAIAPRLVVFLLFGPLFVYRASLQKQGLLDQWLSDSYIMQSRVVDKRDGQTFGHSQRVGELCESVARLLHLSDEACNTIRIGGILHDLGKIAIPDSILLKPSKLTPEEYEIIKTHPVEGAQILAEHPEQRGVAEIVRHHHERWDGAGYPAGLKGDQIPIGSRIVNACDAFDTITQARVFRPTVRTPAEAIRELKDLAGTWYDPQVIQALEKIVSERWGVPIAQPALQPVRPTIRYSQVLGIRPFRLLWAGQAVSYFGDMANTTALAVMLYVLTGSPSMIALGLIAKAAPTILFGLIAGPIVDRFNRQRLMVAADIARALLTVTIPFLALRWLPGVFVVVFLIASASAFFNPAKQAIIPSLVPGGLLVKANSLVASSEKTMELLGYAAAGIVAAIVSWAPLFLLDAATYLVSAVTLLGVPDTRAGTRRQRLRLLSDIHEGAAFVMRNPTLRSTMALTFMAVLFAGLTYPVLVVLAYGPLHGMSIGYGFLEAAIGAGAIIGAFAATDLMGRYRAGALILAGVTGMGLAYALTGLSQSLWLALVFLFLGGIANTVYYVPLISVTQREAPDEVRGRVMSTRFLLVQLGLLIGMALSGPLTNRVGAPVVFVAAGSLCVCAAVTGVAFRSLREARLRDDSLPAKLQATASS